MGKFYKTKKQRTNGQRLRLPNPINTLTAKNIRQSNQNVKCIVPNNIDIKNNRFIQSIDSNYSLEKKNIYNQVMEKGLLDNSKVSHDLVDLIVKAAEYTKTSYHLVCNQELEAQYNNLINQKINTNVTINGFQNQDGITINVNSPKTLNIIVGHEITHLFQETKAYKSLQRAVFKLAKQKGEYNQRRRQLENIYKGSNVNINQELTADLVGDYIFTDQEFVDNLHAKDYGLFTRVYEFLKHLYNLVTAGSIEKRLLENAKYIFDKANTEALEKVKDKNTKELYSIAVDTNGEQFVSIDTDQDIFKGKSQSEQVRIAKQYILDNFRGKELSVGNDRATVTKKSANEYTYPKKALPGADRNSKIKASTELDNLLKISKYRYSHADDGRHSFAKDGWDYYETSFKIADKTYTGLVNIAKNGNKRMFYDITQLKRNTHISSPVSVLTATESIGIPLMSNNVSQKEQNVK